MAGVYAGVLSKRWKTNLLGISSRSHPTLKANFDAYQLGSDGYLGMYYRPLHLHGRNEFFQERFLVEKEFLPTRLMFRTDFQDDSTATAYAPSHVLAEKTSQIAMGGMKHWAETPLGQKLLGKKVVVINSGKGKIWDQK